MAAEEGAEPETEVNEPEPEPEPDAPAAALAYFEAFASGSPSVMAEMTDNAAAGSPAEVYAAVQIAVTEARQQDGWRTDPQELAVTDSGIELCFNVGYEDDCTQFENVTVEGDLLSTFTVDGTPIDDRLAASDATDEAAGVTAEAIGSYRSVQSDELLVALELRNESDSEVQLSLYSAEYISSDGRQVTAVEAFGPFDLRGGASSIAVVMFPAQDVGGTLFLSGWPDDSYEQIEWELDY